MLRLRSYHSENNIKMGIGANLSNEVKQWGTLAMVIVVVSIILVKFKSISGATTATNATVDLFVTGFQEPGNWIIIVIVGLVGFALIKLFGNKKK